MKHERRSRASRWVRYWRLHGKLAPLLVLLGWTLIAAADPGARPLNENAIEVIKLLAGGGILTFGIVAGVTRWIVDPAVQRGVAAHEAKAEKAHAEYITRKEWDEKHTELAKRIDDSHGAILKAIAALGPRRGGHE